MSAPEASGPHGGRGREALSLRPRKCQQPEGRRRKDTGKKTDQWEKDPPEGSEQVPE